ncbi:MAG: MoxR family ATPase [Firmicutes bacterium]|nr:MoxR family ATPase [Bacillota bacterium]
MTPAGRDVLEGAVAPPFDRIVAQVGGMLIGKEAAVVALLTALLAGGHVLLEDAPGVGKTTLAKAFAASLALEFRRIQMTPDLLPADLTGTAVWDPAGGLRFQPGPLFAQVVLADELNRASPRTQSGLLEVMEEGAVTVDGVSRPVPEPFFLIATQNPLAFAGTYPLPEGQLDRFLLRLTLGYPEAADEVRILTAPPPGPARLPALLDAAAVLRHRQAARAVYVDPAVVRYVAGLARATRRHPALRLGASPRAGRALLAAARARAYLSGRGFVLPDDVRALLEPVFLHRLMGRDGSPAPRAALAEVLAEVPVPDAEGEPWP